MPVGIGETGTPLPVSISGKKKNSQNGISYSFDIMVVSHGFLL